MATPHDYSGLGEAAVEQVVMDQLGNQMVPGGSLEAPPDRLTLARLQELFAPVLVRVVRDPSGGTGGIAPIVTASLDSSRDMGGIVATTL
jgi:hypothetical protein